MDNHCLKRTTCEDWQSVPLVNNGWNILYSCTIIPTPALAQKPVPAIMNINSARTASNKIAIKAPCKIIPEQKSFITAAIMPIIRILPVNGSSRLAQIINTAVTNGMIKPNRFGCQPLIHLPAKASSTPQKSPKTKSRLISRLEGLKFKFINQKEAIAGIAPLSL